MPAEVFVFGQQDAFVHVGPIDDVSIHRSFTFVHHGHHIVTGSA